MGLWKCKHKWRITEVSNAIQQDDMGYPLRLCIMTCEKCVASEQIWHDVNEKCLDELKTGKSFLVEWRKV